MIVDNRRGYQGLLRKKVVVMWDGGGWVLSCGALVSAVLPRSVGLGLSPRGSAIPGGAGLDPARGDSSTVPLPLRGACRAPQTVGEARSSVPKGRTTLCPGGALGRLRITDPGVACVSYFGVFLGFL